MPAKKSSSDLFIAIDANAIVHRAFHAYPPTLVNTQGTQVNAVFGFASMLLKVLKDFDPKYIVCAFDTKAPTFRHTEYADYKAHRKPMDDSLRVQFPLVEEVLNAFNIPIIKKEGYEADDIIGTLAHRVEKGKWQDENINMIVVTGDRDLLQLIGKRVNVCLPKGSFRTLEILNREATFARYGYYPEQVVDYKAMVGDASDNIPGVKGIGDKSAIDMLKQYGSLDEIYKNLTELKPKQQKLLGEGVEIAEFSRRLATIAQDVDIDLPLQSCLMKDFKRKDVLDLFAKMEFRTLVDKIPSSADDNLVRGDGAQLDMFGNFISQGSEQSGDQIVDLQSGVDVEFDNESYFKNFKKFINSAVVYISAQSSATGKAFLIGKGVDNSGQVYWMKVNENFEECAACFTDGGDCETFFFGWEDFCCDVSLPVSSETLSLVDIQLASHLTSAGEADFSYGKLMYRARGAVLPETLSVEHIVKTIDMVADLGKELCSKMIDFKPAPEYVQVRKSILKKLGLDYSESYLSALKIDEWVAILLGKIERRGLAVDRKYLMKMQEDLSRQIADLEQGIYKDVGHEFNIKSPKQLSEILYGEIGLPAGRGKNARSTKESILSLYKDSHPAIPKILEYRELTKLQGTYVEAFIKLLKDGEDVIRTDFLLTGTTSGRVSSINPNLQNLPARGELATMFRQMFIPRKGMKYVAIDYSQIEFRFMAFVSQDANLLNDFKSGKDIHAGTAARLFGKDEKEVTKDERSLGKTINVGILYGQTRYGLSGMLNISSAEAQEYIDRYFETYPGVAKYLRETTQKAIDQGYVETMLGRRRYLQALQSGNRMQREAAIREALNMPIQGSGTADLIKLALIDVDSLIEQNYKDKAHVLLLVHDEILFEVDEDCVEKFSKDAAKVMEKVVDIGVPLEVHVGVGKNLAEVK